MRGDFHTHSTLDDGKNSLEEMAAAARAAGLTHFGFSGHSYCPLEEDYCIPGRRSRSIWPGPGRSRRGMRGRWRSLWGWSWTC